MTVEFYRLPGCPYCRKVEHKLEALDVEYEPIDVPSSHAKRSDVEEVSGQTSVPVIVDEKHDVSGMAESDEIVDYLEATYA